MATRIADVQKITEMLSRKCDIADAEIIFEENTNAKGNGHIGIIEYFALKSQTNRKTCFFAAKLAQTLPEFREIGKIRNMYELETNVYSKVIPALKNFEKENGADIFNSTTKLHWSSMEEMKEILIFDNLKAEGFRLWDRMKPANFDHAALVVKELAKLHGVSLSFKKRNPEIFQELTKDFGFNVKNFVVRTNMIIAYRKNFVAAVDNLIKSGREDLALKYRNFVDNYNELYLGLKAYADVNDTICHSDAWMSNFMFKYEKNKPTELRIIDFQAVSVRPPLSDVAMFLYLTCDNAVLDRFEEILKIYHDVMTQTMKQLNVPLPDALRYENLRNTWRKDSLFPILAAPIYIKMQLASEAETAELTSFGWDFSKFLDHPIENPDLGQRWRDVFVFHGENFL